MTRSRSSGFTATVQESGTDCEFQEHRAARQWIPFYTERSAWSVRDRARFRESLMRSGPKALADYEHMLKTQATVSRAPAEQVGSRVAGIYRPGEEP